MQEAIDPVHPSPDAPPRTAVQGRRDGLKRSVLPYLEGVVTVALATAVGIAIDRAVVLPNVSLVYVVPVLVAAARHGLPPSLCMPSSPRSLRWRCCRWPGAACLRS